jgi:hypothetical protein
MLGYLLLVREVVGSVVTAVTISAVLYNRSISVTGLR